MSMRSVECGIPKDSAFIMYAFDSISLCSLAFSFGFIATTSNEAKNLVILNYCQKRAYIQVTYGNTNIFKANFSFSM